MPIYRAYRPDPSTDKGQLDVQLGFFEGEEKLVKKLLKTLYPSAKIRLVTPIQVTEEVVTQTLEMHKRFNI